MDPLESEVIDAARYLRSVRPIDPVALVDYTTVDTSEARVRSILRAHAPALALIERRDGRFVPVPDGAVRATPGPLERLPPAVDRFLDDRLETRLGPDWATGDGGDRLRERVRDLKARYLAGGPVEYDALDADAYLAYHFPRSYAATWYTLAEVIDAGLLPRSLRVLDVGAGVGAHLAAIDAVTPEDALVEYVAVEPSPLAEHLEAVSASLVGRNTHVTIHRTPVESADVGRDVDVALLGNVLSELSEPVAVARRVLERVAADGSWVAIAPADPRTSRQLRAVERALEPAAGVFSPTIRLWPDRRPTDACWSFVERPPLATPRVQERLRAGRDDGDAFVNASVRYSYSIMRPDGVRRFDVTGREARELPLGRARGAIGERVAALVVKLSGDLAAAGNPVYRVGDGSQTEPCFATHVAPTGRTEALETAPYGAVLRLARALVLWNDDEGAINLVVDDETAVDQIAP